MVAERERDRRYALFTEKIFVEPVTPRAHCDKEINGTRAEGRITFSVPQHYSLANRDQSTVHEVAKEAATFRR